MPDTPFLPGAVNENAAHRFRSGAKEVSSILPIMIFADEPEPRFMHQSGGLKRLSAGFLGHFPRRQLPKFVINQWEQLIRGHGFACFNGAEQLGYAGHGASLNCCRQKASLFVEPSWQQRKNVVQVPPDSSTRSFTGKL
jgi:hypothetical protein